MNSRHQDQPTVDQQQRMIILRRWGPLALLILISASHTTSVMAQENPFANQAENSRGSTTGATYARGHSHPDQFLQIQPIQ